MIFFYLSKNHDTLHPASHVTLWKSGGKFASRLNFKGGAFFLKGGAFFLQGGMFFPNEKCQIKLRGALAPLKKNACCRCPP